MGGVEHNSAYNRIMLNNITVEFGVINSLAMAENTQFLSLQVREPLGFPGGAVARNPPANAGDTRDAGSTPGLGRSPGVGNSNPLQFSCLKNPLDRGAWWATVHRVAKSWTQLSDGAHTHAVTLGLGEEPSQVSGKSSPPYGHMLLFTLLTSLVPPGWL